MIKTNLGSTILQLPDLENIPVRKTRAAVEKGLLAHKAFLDADTARYAATQARVDAPQRDSERLGRLFADGAETADVDPNELTNAAKQAEEDAYSVLRGRERAQEHAVFEIRQAIDEERAVWAKIAAADAKKGITKLTTATRMAEAARTELENTIGVLGMLRGVAQHPNVIAVAQTKDGHTFDINPGIEHLRDAIVEATRELQELK